MQNKASLLLLFVVTVVVLSNILFAILSNIVIELFCCYSNTVAIWRFFIYTFAPNSISYIPNTILVPINENNSDC